MSLHFLLRPVANFGKAVDHFEGEDVPGNRLRFINGVPVDDRFADFIAPFVNLGVDRLGIHSGICAGSLGKLNNSLRAKLEAPVFYAVLFVGNDPRKTEIGIDRYIERGGNCRARQNAARFHICHRRAEREDAADKLRGARA